MELAFRCFPSCLCLLHDTSADDRGVCLMIQKGATYGSDCTKTSDEDEEVSPPDSFGHISTDSGSDRGSSREPRFRAKQGTSEDIDPPMTGPKV